MKWILLLVAIAFSIGCSGPEGDELSQSEPEHPPPQAQQDNHAEIRERVQELNLDKRVIQERVLQSLSESSTDQDKNNSR